MVSDKTLAELADEIWAWQQATFGDAMTVQGALNKLRDECEEVVEVWRSILRRPHFSAILDAQLLEELADCFFMLVQIGGLTTDDAEGCGLMFVRHHRATAPPFLMSMGGMHAHALWADRWTGLTFAVAAWLEAAYAIGALQQMNAAIEAKLVKNKARKWAKPAANGTISHVREG